MFIEGLGNGGSTIFYGRGLRLRATAYHFNGTAGGAQTIRLMPSYLNEITCCAVRLLYHVRVCPEGGKKPVTVQQPVMAFFIAGSGCHITMAMKPFPMGMK